MFTLHGTKWFSSATTSQMALTLGRLVGNPAGGSGLALFYVEVSNADGSMNGIGVNRLKDKLGTRMVPTAELTLDGARAIAVSGTKDGVKNITPMLTITRTWNAVCAVAGMRRGLALAKDYARRRVAFGTPLAEKALHVDTLAVLEAEYPGALQIAFRAVTLIGKEECGEISEQEAALLRLLTPIVKLVTAKQAVAVASECLESFGGAGYIEDTGLPRLLRDAQVLPIWAGTTNVLSLDLLRVLAKGGSLEPIVREVHACVQGADPSLKEPAEAAIRATEHAGAWVMRTLEAGGPVAVEAGARRLALTLGRALELALLVREATRSKKHGDDAKPDRRAGEVFRAARLTRDDEPVQPGGQLGELYACAWDRIARLDRERQCRREHPTALVVDLRIGDVARVGRDEHHALRSSLGDEARRTDEEGSRRDGQCSEPDAAPAVGCLRLDLDAGDMTLRHRADLDPSVAAERDVLVFEEEPRLGCRL